MKTASGGNSAAGGTGTTASGGTTGKADAPSKPRAANSAPKSAVAGAGAGAKERAGAKGRAPVGKGRADAASGSRARANAPPVPPPSASAPAPASSAVLDDEGVYVSPSGYRYPPFDPTAPRIEDELAELAAQVPAEEWARFPEDFLDQLDHYIYGTPRR